jgi:hypothetical protein
LSHSSRPPSWNSEEVKDIPPQKVKVPNEGKETQCVQDTYCITVNGVKLTKGPYLGVLSRDLQFYTLVRECSRQENYQARLTY